MAIVFENNMIRVTTALNMICDGVLEECAAELESQTKRNTAVDTGQTKNSWQHRTMYGEHISVIGSDYDNAIWEEFGTGEYALHGDGRKGGWVYYDKHGRRIFTRGKYPKQAFYHAYTSLKNPIVNRIKNAFKGL